MTLRIRWLLIGWMFAISAVAYLDRVNISIAGKLMEAEFGLNDIQLGWVFSSFVLGYALFQAPGGRMADRYGPRKVIGIAAIWWAVFTALTGLAPAGLTASLAGLMLIRFALGLGESVVYPASNRLVAFWIPSQERGLANGLIFAGVGAGAGLSPPLIAYVMSQYGWRSAFLTCAGIGVVAGVVWYWLCRDLPEEHPWLGQEEASYIRAALPARATKQPPIPWRKILTNRSVAALTLSYITFGYAAYIFFSWFFIYLSKVRNLDLKASSFYGMLPFLAMAISSPLGGLISDKLSKRYGQRVGRCGVAGISIAFAALFIALGPRAEDARIASIVLAGGAGALYLSQSMFWSVTSELGGRSAGSVSGLMNMGNQIAGATTASLSPIIAAQFGWTSSFTTAAFLCALGALAWIFVDPEESLVDSSQTAENRMAQAIGSQTGFDPAIADPNRPH